jgi:glycosyltransferase involved in cell wall biosynthesis
MPFDFISRQADRIFSITGKYWYDTAQDTPFAHWKPKMVRVDMAIDPIDFPFLRQEIGPMAFNPPDQRKLIYIGGDSPNKNLGYLAKIMSMMPDVRLRWIGGNHNHGLAQLPNVCVTNWDVLRRSIAEEIVTNYDIMVSVSDSDANPTTLLETRAWGLITACTKESGYYNDPFFTELYLDDIDKTIKAIRGLLNAPSEELYRRAVASRAEIESKYNWDNFGNTVWSGLSQFI